MSVPRPFRSAQWLVRLGEVFAPWAPALWERLGCAPGVSLAPEYWLLRFPEETALTEAHASALFRWCVPVDHSWPINPTKADGFIEKGAQALAAKLGTAASKPRNAFVTAPPLDHGMKQLASNFRGRLLQVFPFPPGAKPVAAPEDEDSRASVLQVFISSKGLYAGVTSASVAKSPYPGGTKFVKQSADDAISRAGGKIVEALTLLPLRGFSLPEDAHWLELGASPGGMTAELLDRGYDVTAIDRAVLDTRLDDVEGLTFHRMDVAAYRPRDEKFDALLCDMNGLAERSLSEVIRLSNYLHRGSPVIFTLKFSEDASESLDDALASLRTTEQAASPELKLELVTHSTYNRRELTCLFRRI